MPRFSTRRCRAHGAPWRGRAEPFQRKSSRVEINRPWRRLASAGTHELAYRLSHLLSPKGSTGERPQHAATI
jgi:hypothetical protein